MAEKGDDVLSLGSDNEGSAISDFSGFDASDVLFARKSVGNTDQRPGTSAGSAGTRKSDAVTTENSKSKQKNEKGSGKANPNSVSKKGKNKAQKNDKHEKEKEKGKKKKSSTGLDIDSLSYDEIVQLREILGFNNVEEEAPSVFDLYGDKPANLNIEVDNDGAYSDVEIVPSTPRAPL